MNKDEYLCNQTVKDFIDWFAKKLDKSGSFNHSYSYGRSKIGWSCSSIYSAYENYVWNNRTLEANQEEVAQNSENLCSSIDNMISESTVEACKAILRWGNVARNNSTWLDNPDNRNKIILDLRNMRQNLLLDINHSDINDQKLRSIRINSGFSKIYSHIVEDFIIYDGRVGAALGLFIRLFCEEFQLESIPDKLRFAFGDGLTSNPDNFSRRNPSSEKYRFPRLNNYCCRSLYSGLQSTFSQTNMDSKIKSCWS